MTTIQKRKAREKRKEIRMKLLNEQSTLISTSCNNCPLNNKRRDPEKKCANCDTYKKLKRIGKKLNNASHFSRWIG